MLEKKQQILVLVKNELGPNIYYK